MSEEQPKRDLAWWAVAILAPIGIIGGPLEMANMAADVIKWQGPWIYLIRYWDETIGTAFATLFSWMAHLVQLPSPPWWLSDWLTLGILLQGSRWRGTRLLPDERNPFQSTNWRTRILPLIQPLVVIVGIVVWPIAIALETRHVLRTYEAANGPAYVVVTGGGRTRKLRVRPEFSITIGRVNAQRNVHIRTARLVVVVSPFLLFFLLWLLNTIYSAM